ncbi:MAG: T9SS type A sorting domain-containing protein, partial [Bacteroidia bacterium]|nr:T9SS type A sorting domain-containing protein [Bacteroidia bacterium]
SVFINNSLCSFIHDSCMLWIPLANPVISDSMVNSVIYYHGMADSIESANGIYCKRVDSLAQWITYSFSEPFTARAWFPCKQDLNDKADSARICITVDSHLKAGSNGILYSIDTLPENKVKYCWKTHHPIEYYLIFFAVSDYAEYNIYAHPAGYPDSVLIQNYIYKPPEILSYYKEQIDYSKGLMEMFSNLFILYPYCDEKYGHCMAPLGGGMEHQTMTTLCLFSLPLTAHEFSHQWFGNLVTCSSWQDIWINEGFGSYSEYLTAQYFQSQWHADVLMDFVQTVALEMDTGSIYVPLEQINNPSRIFSWKLTYKKGAAIIHMLRYMLNNDSVFFQSLRNFLTAFANSTASGDDFKNILEATSGIDFDEFFQQWYYGEGYPKYTVNWYFSNDTLYISLDQFTTGSTPFFKLPVEIKIFSGTTDTIIRLEHTINYQIFSISYPYQPDSIQIDPGKWLVKKVISVTNNKLPEYHNLDYMVYPNPADNFINIIFKKSGSNNIIRMKNINGQLIFEQKISNKQVQIDVSYLPAGLYILEVFYAGSRHYQKIIIL